MASRRVATGILVAEVLGAVAIVGAVWYWQYSTFSRERARLRSRIAEAGVRMKRAREVAADLPGFKRQYERLDTMRQILGHLLPSSPQSKDFVAAFDSWARTVDVRVVNWRYETRAHRRYVEEIVTLRLDGPAHALRDWPAQFRAIEPPLPPSPMSPLDLLMHWHPRRNDVESLVWSVSIYAAPDASRTAFQDVCDDRETHVWLWPYSQELNRLQNELREPCEHLSRLKAIDAQVQAFEQTTLHLRAREGIVDEIKSDIVGGHIPFPEF